MNDNEHGGDHRKGADREEGRNNGKEVQRSMIKEGKAFLHSIVGSSNVDGRVIENEIFTSGDVVAIRGRIGAEGRERGRVPPREGVAPFLPSFLSFWMDRHRGSRL